MINSTLEDMVLYMYNELNPRRKARLEKELNENWALREKFNVLKESFERLNAMQLQSPRKESIEAILDYAGQNSKVSSNS